MGEVTLTPITHLSIGGLSPRRRGLISAFDLTSKWPTFSLVPFLQPVWQDLPSYLIEAELPVLSLSYSSSEMKPFGLGFLGNFALLARSFFVRANRARCKNAWIAPHLPFLPTYLPDES
jgi:hypothetical protein